MRLPIFRTPSLKPWNSCTSNSHPLLLPCLNSIWTYIIVPGRIQTRAIHDPAKYEGKGQASDDQGRDPHIGDRFTSMLSRAHAVVVVVLICILYQDVPEIKALKEKAGELLGHQKWMNKAWKIDLLDVWVRGIFWKRYSLINEKDISTAARALNLPPLYLYIWKSSGQRKHVLPLRFLLSDDLLLEDCSIPKPGNRYFRWSCLPTVHRFLVTFRVGAMNNLGILLRALSSLFFSPCRTSPLIIDYTSVRILSNHNLSWRAAFLGILTSSAPTIESANPTITQVQHLTVISGSQPSVSSSSPR
jgi:hypothetical protein